MKKDILPLFRRAARQHRLRQITVRAMLCCISVTPLGLHNKLRVLVPGIIILVEAFLFIEFFFDQAPSTSQSWGFLTRDFSEATLLILIALLFGGLYRFSDVTHWIDDRTLKGMTRIQQTVIS
jgi:hypothetical protein